MVRHRVSAAVDRFLDATPGWVGPLAVAGTFVLAVRLLGSSTRSLAPELALLLRRVVGGDAAALGVGWLAAYLLGNGSLVAAVAVSLFASGVVTPANLYLLVAGSRLGAAGVVLFVGALDFLQERHLTLSKSLELGVLTAVVTLTVALPATAVGYPLVPLVARRVGVPTATATEPVVGAVATAGALSTRVGSVLAFVAAVAATLAVAAFDGYGHGVELVVDRVFAGRLALGLTLAALTAVPLALVLVPLLRSLRENRGGAPVRVQPAGSTRSSALRSAST